MSEFLYIRRYIEIQTFLRHSSDIVVLLGFYRHLGFRHSSDIPQTLSFYLGFIGIRIQTFLRHSSDIPQTLLHFGPILGPLSPRRTHMVVSACCNDGTEENASNTCGLAVSACCLQLSNTWLCQPVAQTWLCQPAVSMVNATYQHMLRLAVSSGNA